MREIFYRGVDEFRMKSVLLCSIKARLGFFTISLILTSALLLVPFAVSASAAAQDICCPEELEVNTGIFRYLEPPVKCEEVAEIQNVLTKLGFYYGEATGIYDQKTEEAVKKLQKSVKLKVDGVFGVKTRSVLTEKYENQLISVSSQVKPKGKVHLIIDVDKKKLYVYDDNQIIKEYRVAVGTKKTPTPIGNFKIKRKAKNWGTGFGTRWLGLNVSWGIYGIHGTNKPWSIGSRASHGCVRMWNRDVEELYEFVKVGTPVILKGTVFSPYYEKRSPVHKGHKGSEVVLVQKGLIAEGYLKGEADGIFGQGTEDALKKLQKDKGFEVTGQVDTDIWGVIGL